MPKVNVLFVCLGNICRSPTAEGVFAKLLTEQNLSHVVRIDSAGTHAYHVGDAPDLRAQRAAKARGVDLSTLRARKVVNGDFAEFDYILAMDRENYAILQQACPPEHQHKLSLYLDFAPQLKHREVPDPYYGGEYGFERVLDLVETAGAGLLEDIRRRYLVAPSTAL